MYKRVLPQVILVLATVILTTLFQPLSHLQMPAQAQSGCQTFKETGHTLCGKFLTYWQQHGGLAQQGYPISEPFNEKSDLNGQTYQVQYFERAVFEMHPENQPPNDVLLSQLGTFQARQKYGNPPVFPGQSATAPTPPPPGVGVAVPLARDGVSVSLIQVRFLGGCGGPAGSWDLKIQNKSKAPFTVDLGAATPRMSDSTGKTYRLMDPPCAFTSPAVILPDSERTDTPSFDVTNTPTDAAYYDLQINISGTPLTFRYPLK